jgi:hypothetical protein
MPTFALARNGIQRSGNLPLPQTFVRLLVALLLLGGLPGQALAAVEIAFYSRELGGNNYPHAFVALTGTVDSTGEAVDTSFGFTAKSVTPAILFGSVSGEVVIEGTEQIARSDRQFALTLSDDQYRAVMAVVEAWRIREQPSYNLNRRNCVHFVGEVAAAAGLRVEYARGLMKRPRSFLQHVRGLNPQLTTPEVQPARAVPPSNAPAPQPANPS